VSSSLTCPATTPTSTLSLHDALPIFGSRDHGGDLVERRFVQIWGELQQQRHPDARPGPRLEHGAEQASQRFRRLQVTQTGGIGRSEEHTSELQSRENLVCRLLLEKKK